VFHQGVRLLVVLLVACETVEPTPSPTIPEPPPPPVDAGLLTDAPPPEVAAHPQCVYWGPKELIEIETDPATNRGLLHMMNTGPVPSRYIRFTWRPDGLLAADLIFDRYEKPDYKWMFRPMGAKPREKLVRGKSVVARVFVKDGKNYIAGVDVDLHTGMHGQYPDHAYPCGGSRTYEPSIFVPDR
jgi:hypothetical protein